jgi:hypothetical protein
LIGLHHVTIFDFAGEVGSKEHQERQHHRQVAVSGREEGEIPLPADEQTEIFQHTAETTADLCRFRTFALVEGDRFGMVAHVDQGVTEIGCITQLIKIQPHQAPADHAVRSVPATE